MRLIIWRENMHLIVNLPDALHQKFKDKCSKENLPMGELVRNWIREYTGELDEKPVEGKHGEQVSQR